MRGIYLTERVGEARTLLKKAIVERWQNEILNHDRTGASNGPTEGLNLCVQQIKRRRT